MTAPANTGERLAVLEYQVRELVRSVRALEARMASNERWRWGVSGAVATASGVLSSFLTQIGH